MKFIKTYGKWIILSILIFIFGLIVRELLSEKLEGFDTAIYNSVISIKSPFWTYFFMIITSLVHPVVLLTASIILFIVFKNKKYALLSFGNLILVFLINQGLKLLFSRPRPFEWMLVEESGFSFPSAHAMIGVAFYGMLVYLIWQTELNKKIKIILTAVISVLLILIGISRIYLGVHYCSDIIGGFTLSLSYLIIVTSLIDFYRFKIRKKE